MWGSGGEGQLGLGALNKSIRPAMLTSVIKEKFMFLACGRAHTIAVTEMGKIWAWGSNSNGQLGTPDVKSANYPAQMNFFKNKQCRYIAAGGDHSGAICNTLQGTHEVYMWGANDHGQVGIAQNSPAVFIPKMISMLSNMDDKVVRIACASGISAAVTAKGKLYTWGNNDRGQLGHGSTRPRNIPGEVEWFTEHDMTVQQISLGHTHAIALGTLRNAPVVVTWGAAVTNGFQEDQVLPAAVTALEKTAYISASNTHSVSINSELKLFSFGINKYGELGNGKANVQALVRVRFNRDCRIVQAVCGAGFTVALLRGEKPESVTTAHYDKAKEKDDSKPLSKGPLLARDAPPPPPPGGGGVPQLDEKGAESQIAQLLNQFKIKPSDPRAQMYNPYARGAPTGQASKPGAIPQGAQQASSGRGGGGAYQFGGVKVQIPVAGVDDEMPPPPADDDLPPPPSYDSNVETRAASQSSIKSVQAALSAKLAKDAAFIGGSKGGAASARAPAPEPEPEPEPEPDEPPMRMASPEPEDDDGGGDDADLPAPPGDDDDPKKKKKKKKDLAPGWKKVKDPTTGRNYYYNQQTRETTWKRPK